MTDLSSAPILFEEHFDNNSKGWLVGEDQWAKREIRKGKYYMECKSYLLPNSGTSWAVTPGLILPDNNFTIQCNTKWLRNRIDPGYFHSYGLQVGNYRFELFGNGDRRLMFWDGKQDNVVIDYAGANPALFTRGTGIIDITIEIKDGTAKMLGNDQLMFEQKIGSAKGELQLRTTHSEVVEFDDLVVTKLPDVAANGILPKPSNFTVATEENFCAMVIQVHSGVATLGTSKVIGPLRHDYKGWGGLDKDYWSMVQLTPEGEASFKVNKFGSWTYSELVSTGTAEKITQLYNQYLVTLKKCYAKEEITSDNEENVLQTIFDKSEGQEKPLILKAEVGNPKYSRLLISIRWKVE